MLAHLPPPKPDFENLRKVLLRQGEPDRLPLIELLVDREMMEALLGEPIPIANPWDKAGKADEMERVVRFWYAAGYDYVTVQVNVPLPRQRLASDDTALLKHTQRHWDDEKSGPIMSWEDFENYPWPKLEDINYYPVEYLTLEFDKKGRQKTGP